MFLKLFNYYFDFIIKSSSLSFKPFQNYNILLPKFLIINEIFKGEIFTLISIIPLGIWGIWYFNLVSEPGIWIPLLPNSFYKLTINYLTFEPLLL